VKFLRRTSVLFLWSVIAFAAQEQSLESKLHELPGVVEVKKLDPPNGYGEAFQLQILQPLDHQKPNGETFRQRVYLSHLDFTRPMVIVTEGYAARRNYLSEPTRLLRGNQLIVEHRFFGTSRPDSLLWPLLTVKQSADDLHRVAVLLKGLYPGVWVSTGVSKGGQTTCLYRYYYPDDVSVSLPYVAPINIAQEDPRPTEFLRHVGPDSARARIAKFQVLALRQEAKALSALEELAQERKYTFSLGPALMFEFAVLEYPFAFWQYGGVARLAEVPGDTATGEDIVRHLDAIVHFSLYDDKGISTFAPFQYQAYTEMGYYTYDITDLRPFLTTLRNPSNRILAPQGVDLTYRPETFQAINRWLRYEGKNFVYIYGENDPWTASAVELTGMTNAIRMVKKGGNHGSKIRDLDPEQKKQVYEVLEQWTGVKIEEPPATGPGRH
jgi:hypothetical protein